MRPGEWLAEAEREISYVGDIFRLAYSDPVWQCMARSTRHYRRLEDGQNIQRETFGKLTCNIRPDTVISTFARAHDGVA